MIENVYKFFLQILRISSPCETLLFNGRFYATCNYQIMDYFFHQERPDVVSAAVVVIVRAVVFDDMVIMLIINLSILCEDKTSLRSLRCIVHSVQINR